MKRITIALILSLLFHLSQYGLVTYFPGPAVSQTETERPVEFEVIENTAPPKDKMKPIVKTIKDSSKTLDMNTPAQFLAEETNRTKQQTRAQEAGQFRNSVPAQKQAARNRDPEGTEQFTQQLNMPSRSEYQLPNDIKSGSAVNLNTDAYMYASFYNRVTDLFYIRWSQRLNYLWDRFSDETKRSLAGQNWSTDVDVYLDPQGKYIRTVINKKSGFAPFDTAAVFGFQDAKFFPNPPKDKVERDGYIHLRYRINVRVF
jgi:TonB family protein